MNARDVAFVVGSMESAAEVLDCGPRGQKLRLSEEMLELDDMDDEDRILAEEFAARLLDKNKGREGDAAGQVMPPPPPPKVCIQ